ncbi:MAG: hypothetical protein LAT68_01495 [Cyclobacteriaceae bacterium]|nr:hypothetical protein [Cyclobacteriaceae bacterium]MCH8514977.1 hypothetical protein [Cyclobacteriaceae bacterium]
MAFIDDIDSDIEERTTAIFEIERVLFSNRFKFTSLQLDIFSVQSVAMIYSIWEGFIQKAFVRYAEELNKRKIKITTASDNLLIFYMETNFAQLKNYPNKLNKKTAFFSDLQSFYVNNELNFNSSINTQSNVNFEVMNGLLQSFCLEKFPENWKNYRRPDPNLKDSLKTFLNYRNAVAHGGDISSEEKVTQEVFDKYKKLVDSLMYEIMFKMVEGLNNQTYLK